jgi:hypothetical protein
MRTMTRRTAIALALATLAAPALPAAEVRFEPVPVLLRETWSDGREPTIGWTWLRAPCQRPVRYVHTCGDVTIVNEEVMP